MEHLEGQESNKACCFVVWYVRYVTICAIYVVSCISKVPDAMLHVAGSQWTAQIRRELE